MIPGRRRIGIGLSLLLSLLFGGLWSLLSSAELLPKHAFSTLRPLAFTVRFPTVVARTNAASGGASLELTGKLFRRGQLLTAEQLHEVHTQPRFTQRPRVIALVAIGLLFAMALFLVSRLLAASGGVVAFGRTHVVIFGVITVLLLLGKGWLLFTGWSAYWLPAAAAALIFGQCLGARAAVAVAVLSALGCAALMPFDPVLLFVLLLEGIAAGALLRGGRQLGRLLLGTGLAAGAGIATFSGVQLLLGTVVSPAAVWRDAVRRPLTLLGSDLAASLGGALAGGVLAVLLVPLIALLLGKVSRSRLTALADFENELLKQMAAEAPGSWAHSTNLANMAEMAANHLGSNGLLLRVGAYYHDVGKSLYSGFFVENQQGEQNPHNSLDPARSAEAIISHVADGVELAIKHGVPQAIVEFIYTHHGNDRVEYFWHKANSSPDAQRYHEEDFHYPGMPPQTKEQGILSLCDAVEAASRTLKNPDTEEVERLVHQVVFGKVRSGMLDASGLDARDLRLLIEAIIEFLKCSLHARVKYPWQERDENRPTGIYVAGK